MRPYKNPHLMETTVWARTPQNTAIALYSSAPLDELEGQPLLFIGGVHGDEPEGVVLALALLDWLGSLQEAQGNSLHPWILIPCINPDGYEEKTRTNSRGVDLNRNFPAQNWSREVSQERYNSGDSPASEPEVKALSQLIVQYRPRLIIHAHSWDPCIVLTGPSGMTEARLLSECSGYKLVEDIGYPTPGSLGDFGWENQIPVICIEEKAGTPNENVWPHFSGALQTIFTRPQEK